MGKSYSNLGVFLCLFFFLRFKLHHSLFVLKNVKFSCELDLFITKMNVYSVAYVLTMVPFFRASAIRGYLILRKHASVEVLALPL